MAWKTLDDMEFAGKVALVRVDLNVPVRDGQVSDASRIERIAPTVTHITARGGRAVLLAHFGRPKGKPVEAMSLRVVRPALERRWASRGLCRGLHRRAGQARGGGHGARRGAAAGKHPLSPRRGSQRPEFAAALAALGDVYVNDAFSAAHRAHASTEGIAHLLPACAGRLMEAELRALEAALGNPERPVVAVVGGAKVSTKLDLLGNLLRKVDHVVIGGGMANTFLAAQGHEVGRSLAEHDMADGA
jgi:phosphoglycerate kinase